MEKYSYKEHSTRYNRMLYTFVLTSFILPIAYLVVRIVIGQSGDELASSYRSRADYILMLLECLLGIVVIHVPSFLSKKFRFVFPPFLYSMYIVFLYCAIFLGEVRSFYYVVPYWDDILHCMSSVMSGIFGFMMISILNRNSSVTMKLSPIFAALFAFCFSVMVGAVWEIYEFSADSLFGLNMQKFILEDGTVLVGSAALADTMYDIIIDCIGAAIASVLGYIAAKVNKTWFEVTFH